MRTAETDEVDLVAIRRAIITSRFIAEQSVPQEFTERTPSDYVMKLGAETTARAMSREIVRLDGHRNGDLARTYQFSAYGIHPDTAEQIIAALDYLIQRQGPRLKFPTKAQRHAPEVKRNAAQAAPPPERE